MMSARVGNLGRAFALGTLLLVSAAAPLVAQPPARGRGGPGGMPADSAQRARLEREFHARVTEIVQRELKLSPEQTRQLETTTQRFEAQRRPLWQREMQVRRSLRGELRSGDSADGARVDAYLRELLQLQRRRLDVIEGEQRALAEFLTPVQRARYMALQENLRARVEQQRSRGGRSASGTRGGPPPPR
jgi:periplasmic protein CpxP/Spy